MKRKTIWPAILLGVLLAPWNTAHAVLINYSFTGSGSGDLDGRAFLDAGFVVSINADTVDWVMPFRQEFWIDGLVGTIAIDGIGTATFSNPLFVYGFYGCGSPGGEAIVCEFGEPPTGGEDGLGFGDYFGGNMIDLYAQDLTDYDLRSDFGPITAENNILQQFVNRATSLGALTYTSMSTVTFVSRVVPEPSTLALLSVGLVGLRFVRKRWNDRTG